MQYKVTTIKTVIVEAKDEAEAEAKAKRRTGGTAIAISEK